jgi:hypothetical protein
MLDLILPALTDAPLWKLIAVAAAPIVRLKLNWVRATLTRVILLRALRQCDLAAAHRRHTAGKRYAPLAAPPSILRASFGSALRRAMRGKTLSETARAMRNVVDEIDVHVARIVRRLRRGLRRLRLALITPVALIRLDHELASAAPRFADSS